jgi:hypothetical protein
MNDPTGLVCSRVIIITIMVFAASVHAQNADDGAGKVVFTEDDIDTGGTKYAARQFTGPSAIDNRLATDSEDKPNVLDVNLQGNFDAWKAQLKERSGLDFTVD